MPFLSYGSNSLAISFVSLGLVCRADLEARKAQRLAAEEVNAIV